MQKLNNQSILFIFIISCYIKTKLWSYNKMTIVRVKTVKMLPLFNFCIKVFARIDTFKLSFSVTVESYAHTTQSKWFHMSEPW